MTRWERKLARKEERKDKAIERHAKKQKETLKKAKKSGKPNTVRKVRWLKDGGIAFGNTAKIGRTGLWTMVGITILAVIFFFGMYGYYDEWLESVFQEAHAEKRSYIAIGIFKSKSCMATVAMGGDCMTYRELVKLFDNTNQAISGKFVEEPIYNDVVRMPPTLTDHWQYYHNAGMKYLIGVDPDIMWYNTNTDIRVIIEPGDFTYYDKESLAVQVNATVNTNQTAAFDTNELIQFHNLYVDGCSFARVTGDPELVIRVLNYFMRDCEENGIDWQPSWHAEQIPVRALPVNPDDYHWYKYNTWLNAKALECKTKC